MSLNLVTRTPSARPSLPQFDEPGHTQDVARVVMSRLVAQAIQMGREGFHLAAPNADNDEFDEDGIPSHDDVELDDDDL